MKGLKKRLTLTLAALFMFGTVAGCDSKSALISDDMEGETTTSHELWGTYSLEKILKSSYYNTNNPKLPASIDVMAALGEAESGQIIVTAGNKGVKEYTVKTADLTCKNGAVYKAENVDVFFQFYCYVTEKTGLSDYNADHFPSADENIQYSGWTPDALIPQKYSIEAKENFIDPNANQGISFDFNIPINQPAGEYTGEFTVVLDGVDYKIPVTLTVWEFNIQDVQGFNFWDIGIGFFNQGEMTADHDGLYYKYYDMLLKYKVTPYHFNDLYDNDPVLFVEKLREYWDNPSWTGVLLPDLGAERERMYNYFSEIAKACIEDGVNYFSKIRFYHQAEDEPQAVPGMLDQAVTVVDETSSILNDIAVGLQTEMIKDTSGNFVTGFNLLDERLRDEIIHDIVKMPQIVTTYYEVAGGLRGKATLCPQVQLYESSANRRYYEYNGKLTEAERYLYTCINPKYPYPGNHIDDYLTSPRSIRWMQKRYDIEGYMCWEATMLFALDGSGGSFLTDGKVIDPYMDPQRFNSDGWSFALGDGQLVYPMKKYHADEPLPSLRLLAFRDGQEDYDTMCLTESLYGSLASEYSLNSDSCVENLKKTTEVYHNDIYADVHPYNDGVAFERARRSLGGLTEAASNESKTIVMQEQSADGNNVILKFYSKADEIAVNGLILKKTGNYFAYAKNTVDGDDSVSVSYKVGNTIRSFELMLASKTHTVSASTYSQVKEPSLGESTVNVTSEGVIEMYVKSYVGKNDAITLATKLDFDIPMPLDYEKIDTLSFTLDNNCAEQMEIEVYFKDKDGNILTFSRKGGIYVDTWKYFDKILLFPYETWTYTVTGVCSKLKEYDFKPTTMTLRFINAETGRDLSAEVLNDRQVNVYGFKWTSI